MAPLNIAAIVAAWTALYKQLDDIGYIPSPYVAYPVHNPPIPVPQSPQVDMPLHPLVLELLRRLPYPADWDCADVFEILPRTRAISYIDD